MAGDKRARPTAADDNWELRFVRTPAGTHRPDSRDTEGAQRELLYADGTNDLLGPPEAIPASEADLCMSSLHEAPSETVPPRGLSPAEQRLAEALTDLLSEVIRSVVIPLFRDVVAPAARQRIGVIGERIRSGAAPTATQSDRSDPGTVVERAPTANSTAVAPAADMINVEMTPTQVREALLHLLASDHYSSRLRAMLASARVIGDPAPTQLMGAIQSVVAGEIGSLATSELAALMDFLSSGVDPEELAPNRRSLHGERLAVAPRSRSMGPNGNQPPAVA